MYKQPQTEKEKADFCIYTVVFGKDNYFAVYSLWSYRKHHPNADIFIFCLDSPPRFLQKFSEEFNITLVHIPVSELTYGYTNSYYHIAVTSRFIDIPKFLEHYKIILSVDADTLCLREIPFQELHSTLTTKGKLLAMAPEVSKQISGPFVEKVNLYLKSTSLDQYQLDQSQIFLNAGVIAFLPEAAEIFDALAKHLYFLSKQGSALIDMPTVEQCLLNFLHQESFHEEFYILSSDWNTRESYKVSIPKNWPSLNDFSTQYIWHCRNTFEQLFQEVYPDKFSRLNLLLLKKRFFVLKSYARRYFKKYLSWQSK